MILLNLVVGYISNRSGDSLELLSESEDTYRYSIELAAELQASSDVLTNMARMYCETKDKKYEEIDVLDRATARSVALAERETAAFNAIHGTLTPEEEAMMLPGEEPQDFANRILNDEVYMESSAKSSKEQSESLVEMARTVKELTGMAQDIEQEIKLFNI